MDENLDLLIKQKVEKDYPQLHIKQSKDQERAEFFLQGVDWALSDPKILEAAGLVKKKEVQ